MVEEQPWDAETAEKYIHQLARCDELILTKKPHAEERMMGRGILARDILYVLRHGRVLETKTSPSTRDGYFKYAIQSKTPNSDEKIIRVIAVPCLHEKHMVLITVMWAEEKTGRGDG